MLLRRGRFRVLGFTSGLLGVAGLLSGGLLLCHSMLGAPLCFCAGVWERGGVYPIIAWQLLADVAIGGRHGIWSVRWRSQRESARGINDAAGRAATQGVTGG